MSEKEVKKVASASAVFRVYWGFVKRHPVLLGLIVMGGIIIQSSYLIYPLYLRQFFNTLSTGTHDSATTHVLLITLAIVASTWLLEWIGRRIQDISNMHLSSEVMTELYTSSFGYLLGHSYNFFISNFAGSLTHKVSRYSRSFELLFDTIMISFFPTFLFVIGAISVLYMRNATLGLLLLGWTIMFIIFQLYLARLRQPARAVRSEADTKVTGSVADAVSNQSTVSLFAGGAFESAAFRKIVEAWRAATMRVWYFDTWMWSAIGLFMLSIEVLLLYVGVRLWEKGLFTVGDFILIQSYLMVTFDRLVGINRELRRFFDAIADAGEMVAILQMPHEIKDAPDAKDLSVTNREIRFEDVSFYFNDNTSILKNFSLSIPSRQRVALVGPSGAGKSTLTKLLLRFFDLKSGSITIDGQDIKLVTQDSLREAISFVPQEPVLFHRSLMDNIRYGKRDATDEEVIEAAKLAHCHEFIMQLPEDYKTFVGERGIKLSGGERQRVAIARAILKDAPILVLDEATSSLDSESEALIQDALDKLMQHKTVLVIAHRLSTIMKMDRILVLQKGYVVADGTHEKLLSEDGLYKKLWSIQAGGFLVPEETADTREDLEEQSDDESELDDDDEEGEEKLAQPTVKQ